MLLAGTTLSPAAELYAEEKPFALNINAAQMLQLISTFTSTPDTTGPVEIDYSSPGKALSDIRRDILSNPSSFSKYATPIPFRQNGELIGYKLQPQGNRELFNTLGLNPNDVILSINDIKLNTPGEGLKALQTLSFAKQLNLRVLRNGTEQPLQFDIP